MKGIARVLIENAKIIGLFAVLVTANSLLIPNKVYADCQGCCSSHGGVVCRNGITQCGDGTPLSTTCRNKGCSACNSPPPPTDLNDIDNDGDGYTENQGDCNDNNPIEHPGQKWYKDLDNDGYSDGTIIIACSRPRSYKIAAELYQVFGDINDLISDPQLSSSPVIYSIQPTTLLINNPITIIGSSFGSINGSGYVNFYNNARTTKVISWNDNRIVCELPQAAQSGCVEVVTVKGKSNCVNYTVLRPLPWLMLLAADPVNSSYIFD